MLLLVYSVLCIRNSLANAVLNRQSWWRVEMKQLACDSPLRH